MKTLLDTSFLLFCAERGRNYLTLLEKTLLDKVEPVVLKGVLEELNGMVVKGGKKGAKARVALTMTNTMEVVQDPYPGRVDDKIIKYASTHGTPVVTVDRKLVKRLAEKGLPYITFTETGRPVVSLILR